jgi:hypothetical protein
MSAPAFSERLLNSTSIQRIGGTFDLAVAVALCAAGKYGYFAAENFHPRQWYPKQRRHREAHFACSNKVHLVGNGLY